MMSKQTPQTEAQKKAEKLKKLRTFVRQNQGLHGLNPLSNPDEVEKALKSATLEDSKKN